MCILSDVDRLVYNARMLDVASDPSLPARERIVRTAHALFYRDGIRATGIDRVIGQAGVTKVTFYRHFPSKNDLILAFMEFRHRLWMDWFNDALKRHGPGLQALMPVLAEWFAAPAFRGCAFINAVAELGGSQPEVTARSLRHKDEMVAAIAGLLPASRQRMATARCAAMSVDGAIVRAQMDGTPEQALKTLRQVLRSIG